MVTSKVVDMLIYVAAPLEAADLVREASTLIHEAGTNSPSTGRATCRSS